MKQARQLPKTMRNPIIALEMVQELREHADAVAKEASEAGRAQRERGRVLKIRAFAAELQAFADAKIGTHEDALGGE